MPVYDLSSNFSAQKARERLKVFFDAKYTISIERVLNKRTLRQNSYLHAVIQLYAIHLGYNLDEAKTHLKRHCDFMNYDKNGEVFFKRTRDLDTKDCTTFIDWIRNRAATEGFYIPDADEMKKEWQQVQDYIKGYAEYL